MSSNQDVDIALKQILYLSELTTKFANVHRTMLYSDKHYENDTEHSFHLAIVATEIAANYYPKLDIGLISQFSIVHDLPEIYAGDVPSWEMSEEQKIKKEKAEKSSLKKLLKELPPHTADLLRRFEEQEESEARFVRLIDKLLPPAIHAVAMKANKRYFVKRFGMETIEDVNAANERLLIKLREMFPEYDFLILLRQVVAEASRDRLFEETNFTIS